MQAPGPAHSARETLRRLINARPGELGAALAAAAYVFCIMAAYYMLRPVRDAMGIAGGVENLRYLFLISFVVTLGVVPLYGWACARLPRSRFVPWVSLFLALNLLIFHVAFRGTHEPPPWVAQAFFVWVGVFNVFVLSVYWSFMTDLFSAEQAARLFGFLAAGGSAGAVAGPAVTTLLAGRFGIDALLMIAIVLLLVTVTLVRVLLNWERTSPASPHRALDEPMSDAPVGGNPLAGLRLFAGSPYLRGIGVFVLLFTSVGTFMYMLQAELLRDAIAGSAERTRILAAVDLAVNVLCIPLQVFVTGRLMLRFGLAATLVAVPLAMVAGFAALAAAPVLIVLFIVQIIRRAGDYSLTRPARELLFTAMNQESRYKAKNVVDTVIYRGGDAANAWLYTGLVSAGLSLSAIAAVGAGFAAAWWVVGRRLGRAFGRTAGVPRRMPAAGLPAQDHDEPV